LKSKTNRVGLCLGFVTLVGSSPTGKYRSDLQQQTM
jgi:hypothetical protein